MFTQRMRKKSFRICGWFCGQLFTFREQRSNGISPTTFFRYYTETDNTSVQRKRKQLPHASLQKHIAALFNRKKFTINITCSVHILHIQSSTHSGMNSFWNSCRQLAYNGSSSPSTRWEFDLGIAGLMVLTSASG